MSENSLLTSDALNFLEQYLNNAAPTGYETAGQQMWLDRITPYIDEHFVDHYGTTVGVIGPDKGFKVVIEAHADEISWVIHYITEDGFLYVKRNGGSDHQIAPSKRVNVHTAKGPVKGVFGWPAIHMRDKENETAPKADNIFVDVGCRSRDEVEKLGIHVGTVLTYPDEFMVMNGDYWVGRAVDNRIGGFVIAEVARLLKENNCELPFSLYLVNSVQEEVGLKGATMITETIRPDIAIVNDVCHDTRTPMVDKTKQGDMGCGDGPVITYAPAVQNKLLDLMVRVAEENKIPFQRRAASRATGTDTDAFAYSTGGVPSALLALPLRYMHTTVETVHRDDVENLIRWYYHALLAIEHGHDLRYLS